MNETRRPALPSPQRFLTIGLGRLLTRAELLGVVAAGCLGLMLLAGLDWTYGVGAMAATLAYVLLRSTPTAIDFGAEREDTAETGDQGIERQGIIDAMPDPAWVLDQASVVLCVNAPARALFPKLRTGIQVSSAVRSPDVIEAVERAFTTDTAQTASLHERVPIERRLAVVVAPLRLHDQRDGEPSLLLTLRDLTEQDRLAQMRADFVANASHELRTPLASLRGFVETLQGPARNDPAARERFLKIMSTQADRMTRLIDDLLSLSRVEMREHVAPTATVDLVAVALQAMQGLEPQAADGRIALVLDTEQRPLPVRGDRDELLQVLQNLIQNAIKYGRDDGEVNIRIGRVPGTGGKPARISVAVTDNGPGIAAAHIPRLTERFYRVNALQSRDKGGTGLGLAIVKHIVIRHSGELIISSEVGVGSTFKITLDEALEIDGTNNH